MVDKRIFITDKIVTCEPESQPLLQAYNKLLIIGLVSGLVFISSCTGAGKTKSAEDPSLNMKKENTSTTLKQENEQGALGENSIKNSKKKDSTIEDTFKVPK